MSIAILLVAFLPALLVGAAMFDLTTYTIPNIVTGSMLVLFVILLATLAIGGHPLSLSATGFHLLAGLLGLVAGITMFAFNWVGGGDAKLFAVAALWLGWDALYDYAVLSALLGGCITVFLVAIRRVALPPILDAQPWIRTLADRKQGVPYGIALAMAALTVLPETDLFRLAATS